MEEWIDRLAAGQWRGEDIGGGDRVLDREVDADATDGRHGVGSVADRQQPGLLPACEAVELDRQQVQVADVIQLREVELGRRGFLHFFPNRVDPTRLVGFGGALRNQEGALPVSVAIDHHQQSAALDIATKRTALLLLLADAKPEHVHRRAEVFERQHGADDRRAPISSDRQAAADFPTVFQPHPGNAALFLDKSPHGRIHRQVKPREGLCLLTQEIEEVPLRHHRDKRRGRVEMRQVPDRPFAPGHPQLSCRDLVVRSGEEALEHPELVENLHRRGVHRVSAKIAKEIGVLFQHQHLATGSGEEEAGHHPSRSTTDNDQVQEILSVTKVTDSSAFVVTFRPTLVTGSIPVTGAAA